MPAISSIEVKGHLLYALANAPVRGFPFPHFYVEGVFPRAVYRSILGSLPERRKYRELSSWGRVTAGAYSQRTVVMMTPEGLKEVDESIRPFWTGLGEALLSQDVMGVLMRKFDPQIKARFAKVPGQHAINAEGLLVRDATGMALGPHTDKPTKIITALFYLPETDEHEEAGTAFYMPKDRGFTCPGTTHHSRDQFDLITRMPFRPNSMLCFAKGDTSFHGLEPVVEGLERSLIIMDLYAPSLAIRVG